MRMTRTDESPVVCDGGHLLAQDFGHAARGGSKTSVTLIVESAVTTAVGQPVTVGVPWPRGVLTDDLGVLLIDPSGRRAPLQATPLAHWPDRSVKWLLLDYVIDPVVEACGAWSLEARSGEPKADPRPSMSPLIEESERHYIINSGPASFTVDREVLAPILQAEIGGRPVLDVNCTTTVLTDARGRARRPLIERCEIEASGPVRATLRLDGAFDGSRRNRLRFVARLSFFAGLPLVRIDLTLHNPRRARHPGGLWDLGDPGSILFRDLSLRLGLSGTGPRPVAWTEGASSPWQTTGATTFEIYQDSSGGENWSSPNHVNRNGEVPCRFRGYRVRQENETSSGLRASPIVSVQAASGTVTAAIAEFWQQFPKAIDTEGGTLNLRLFPGQFGDLFELQGGEQKTHTAWLHFGRDEQSALESLGWVHRAARIHCTPEWYAECRVIPYLSPSRPGPGDRYHSLLSGVVDGPRGLAARREVIDEYGWRNYGEIYADHEGAYYKGHPPVISHYNNQYDVINGLLIQYFRTGDARWLDLADPLARHVIDIDIYHTREDRAAYNGGMFWHTDHYRDAATSTHRTYSRANCEPINRAYGGGPCNEHNYTTGLLHYYYLTGSPRARDAVLGLADWVVAMDDGRKTILGLIDDGPTGLASSTTQSEYHGPGRGCGNSINALLDGWLLTGSREYFQKAEGLIRRAIQPSMDIPALDLLETELRWSYTVFLSVLERYLGLKAEAGEIDAMYAYARSCLLAFAVWMLDNEVPYFDRPEKLEYPTEAWAAQEFRKANVLRVASRHVDEPLRSRLIRRGCELADRAWIDLLRFESRDVARSVAIIMVEGSRDSFWRSCPIGPLPSPSGRPASALPEVFVPQRRRVLARLKTPRGTLEIITKLASPRNWLRFFSRRSDI